MPFEEREERWAEALEIVLSAWRDGRIAYQGKHYQIPDTELFPKPVQHPAPPTFVMVTQSDSSVEFAARRLFPFILGQGPDWDDAKHKVELYRDIAREAGHNEADIDATLGRTAQLKQIHVSTSVEKGREEYEKGLMWYFQTSANRGMFGFNKEPQPFEYYTNHRSVIIGAPEMVREQIEEYRAYTGINNIVCWFNCGSQPQEQVRTSMQLFADEVMPHFK